MNWTNRLPQLTLIAMSFTLASCAPIVNPSPYPNTSYPNISAASTTPTELPEAIRLLLTPRAAMTQTYTPTPDIKSTPLPTETRSPFEPTPIQLPQNWELVNREYCDKPHLVYLPISEAQGLTDDDITEKLMSLYLDYYNNPQAPDFCRIDGYRIERVFFHEGLTYPTITRRGDFMRQVDFSIKLIQLPTYWMGAYGEIDQQNWFHISDVLAIYRVKADSVYTMHRVVGGG